MKYFIIEWKCFLDMILIVRIMKQKKPSLIKMKALKYRRLSLFIFSDYRLRRKRYKQIK